MNEGVLIRYLGKWMTFWRPLGLALRGRLRWGELSDRCGVGASIADAHVDSYFCFQMRFYVILERFWNEFGRFWEATMDVEIDFWEVFSMFF